MNRPWAPSVGGIETEPVAGALRTIDATPEVEFQTED
jgi:hypothetical protein